MSNFPTRQGRQKRLKDEPHALHEQLGRDDLVEQLLLAIYGELSVPVFVPANAAKEYESLLLRLWTQQWTSLMAAFSFSGGSLANRKISGKAFDLQVVPFKALRHVVREVPTAIVVDSTTPSLRFERQRWVSAAAHDLYDSGDFRRHLSSLGSCLSSERYFFPVVASLALTDKPLTEHTLVREIKHLYPEANTGISVKRDVLNACFSGELSLLAGLSQSELLSEVCSVDSGDTFADTLPNAKSAISKLADTDHKVILSLLNRLLGSPVSDHGIALVRHALENVDADELQNLINGLRPVLPMVVSANPRLCVFPDTWRGDKRQQFQVFESLCQHLDVAREHQRSITLAILGADAHGLASSLVAAIGPSVLETVLDAFNRGMTGRRVNVPEEWINELRAYPQLTAEWLSHQPSLSSVLLEAVTYLVSPASQSLDKVPIHTWLSALDGIDRSRHERSMCYVLTIGMRALSPDSYLVFVPALETVHDAVMDRDMAYEEWLWLSAFLPELGWLSNWDRAERLRRGVIDRWCMCDWPVDVLLHCFSTERNWQLFVHSCAATASGNSLLWRCVGYLDSHESNVPFGTQQVLRDAIR